METASGLVKYGHNEGHTSPRDHYLRYGIANNAQETDKRWAAEWVRNGCGVEEMWVPLSGFDDEEKLQEQRKRYRAWADEVASQTRQTAKLAKAIEDHKHFMAARAQQRVTDDFIEQAKELRRQQLTDLEPAIFQSVLSRYEIGPTFCVRRAQLDRLILHSWRIPFKMRKYIDHWLLTGVFDAELLVRI